jgi:hypothetical protein
VAITAKQRCNFLRFLKRHGLKRYLVLDYFHRRPLRASKPLEAKIAILRAKLTPEITRPSELFLVR